MYYDTLKLVVHKQAVQLLTSVVNLHNYHDKILLIAFAFYFSLSLQNELLVQVIYHLLGWQDCFSISV